MCQKTKACTAAYGAATRALKAISKVRTATTTSPPSRRSVSPPRSPPGGWPLIFLLSRGHLGFLCSEELLDAHVFSLAHLFHLIVIFFPSCHLLFVPLWPSFVLPLTVVFSGVLSPFWRPRGGVPGLLLPHFWRSMRRAGNHAGQWHSSSGSCGPGAGSAAAPPPFAFPAGCHLLVAPCLLHRQPPLYLPSSDDRSFLLVLPLGEAPCSVSLWSQRPCCLSW